MAVYVFTIEGTTKQIQPGWQIQETANGRNRLDCVILSLDASYRFALDDEVIFTEDGTRIFGGLVDRPVEAGLFNGGSTPEYPNPLQLRLSAADFSIYASRIHLTAEIPAGTYKAFLTVVANALAAQGVTLDAGQVTGPNLPALSYDDKPIIDVLNDGAALASANGAESWIWEINYSKVLRSYEAGTEAAPFNIADGDQNVIGDIVVEQPRSSEYANYINVDGGTGQAEVVDSFTGNGVLTEFEVNYQVAQVRGYVSFGGNNETLRIIGDPDPATWTFDPDGGGDYGTITRTSAPTGAIEFPYVAQFPRRVTADGGGPVADRVTRTYKRPDVFDLTVLEDLAESYLARDSASPKTVRYAAALSKTDLHPGQTQTLTSPKRNLSGTVTLTAVTIRNVGANFVQRFVTAVTSTRIPRTLREVAQQAFSGGSTGTGVTSGDVTSGGVGGSGTAGQLTRWATGSTVGDSGGVATGDITNNAVTMAKIEQAAADAIVGREAAGTGNLSILTSRRAVWTGTGHPQGVVSAPLGTRYVDTNTGYTFEKLGGGSTAYGWYYAPRLGGGIGGAPVVFGLQNDDASSLTAYGGYGWDSPITHTATTTGREYVAGKPWFQTRSTSNVSGNIASVTTQTSQVRWWESDFDAVFTIRTPSDIADLRFWLGVTTAGITDTDSATGSNFLFRYATPVPDGGWVGYTRDGVTSSVTATVAAIAASTIYTLRIRFVRSGTPTVYFSVNNGTEISKTTNLPATGVTSFFTWSVTTKAAAVKTLGFQSLHVVVGAQS